MTISSSLRRGIILVSYLVVVAIVLSAWLPSALVYFRSGLSGSLIAVSIASALLGVVAILAQLVLISRARWLEPAFGFDRLTRIHRVNGLAAFSLVTAHIPLIIAGYSLRSGLSFPEQIIQLQSSYQYVTLALVAHLLLVITIASSVVIVRKMLAYELWHLIHMLNYIVLFLAIWHQLSHGTTLNNSEWFPAFWLALHGAVLLNLVYYRFLGPVVLYMRHRFRVERIEEETATVTSIYVSGRRLDEFNYQAGQFAKWRFLQKNLWHEEHPFTISIAPNGEYLRCTVKAVGDFTKKIGSELRADSRVVLSGPFGRFVLDSVSKRKLLFIAGGIGVTPLRALLEEVDESYDVEFIYAARNKEDLALRAEIEQLMKGRLLHFVLSSDLPSSASSGHIDKDFLESKVGDIAEREVFICGPPSMMDDVEKACEELGVEKRDIHTERFSL